MGTDTEIISDSELTAIADGLASGDFTHGQGLRLIAEIRRQRAERENLLTLIETYYRTDLPIDPFLELALGEERAARVRAAGNEQPPAIPAEGPDRRREDSPRVCPVCGADLVWVDCWLCGGFGEYNETETDPLEGDPVATCPECAGIGGYLECPDMPHTPG